jgi:hypothetical protein
MTSGSDANDTDLVASVLVAPDATIAKAIATAALEPCMNQHASPRLQDPFANSLHGTVFCLARRAAVLDSVLASLATLAEELVSPELFLLRFPFPLPFVEGFFQLFPAWGDLLVITYRWGGCVLDLS